MRKKRQTQLQILVGLQRDCFSSFVSQLLLLTRKMKKERLSSHALCSSLYFTWKTGCFSFFLSSNVFPETSLSLCLFFPSLSPSPATEPDVPFKCTESLCLCFSADDQRKEEKWEENQEGKKKKGNIQHKARQGNRGMRNWHERLKLMTVSGMKLCLKMEQEYTHTHFFPSSFPFSASTHDQTVSLTTLRFLETYINFKTRRDWLPSQIMMIL